MDLSILIPARNEMFLYKTIEDILANIELDTEIIVVLDGQWADPEIVDDPRVNIIYLKDSIGQRAATNLACRLSKAKYVMKVDAHCKFDKGFDRKLIEKMQDNYTMVPIMKNLWAFDWNCRDCNWKKYQGPTPEKCERCGSTNLRRKLQWRIDARPGETGYRNWRGRRSPSSYSYCFDKEPHFQYFNEFRNRDEYKKDLEEKGLTESMSLQGSCFIMTRAKYLELNICDETFGSWGNQGIEVAAKTWLSGGKVVTNHSTWYAHLFRTQGGDFSFPYEQRGVKICKAKVKALFWENKYEKQIYPLSWLLKKFWPVKGWKQEDLDNIIASEYFNRCAGGGK
jgi:glycosyltransferase involved in cell wall biosynthesis